MIKKGLSLLLLIYIGSFQAQKIGLLKYKGGGDWYANPSALPNLVKFCNAQIQTKLDLETPAVEVGSSEIYSFPMLHMTGHGNVFFSNQEVENLRTYLISGGFLHIDDNYGMDVSVRREMKKVFPELQWQELPINHPIYHQKFKFLQGLPKIHAHDNKPPQGFGLIYEGRLVVYYTYETDLGDGWENPDVHQDTPEIRQKALEMGANIVNYIFTN
ncbi:MAG: DUF4159 domain-containing protein [Chitinophagales bacterium]|jgi:hypothetical protein|nr:DUF4159 domain-containing protein [Chitinophagales bacterium]